MWARALKASTQVESARREYVKTVAEIIADGMSPSTGQLDIAFKAVSRPDYHLVMGVTIFNNTGTSLLAPIEIHFMPDTRLNGFMDYTPNSGLVEYPLLRNFQFDPQVLYTDPLFAGMRSFAVTIPALTAGSWASYSFEVRFNGGYRRGVVRPQVNVTSGAFVMTDVKALGLTPPLLLR